MRQSYWERPVRSDEERRERRQDYYAGFAVAVLFLLIFAYAFVFEAVCERPPV